MTSAAGEAQHGLFEETPARVPDPAPSLVRVRRLVVEVSGAATEGGPAAFSAVVRDPEPGGVIGQEAGLLSEPEAAEPARAGVIAGIQLARTLDAAAEIEVRVPDRAVVERFAGEPGHDRVIWTWVARGDNRRADQLLRATLAEATPPRTL